MREMDDKGPVDLRHEAREASQHREERLLIVLPQDDAEESAAGSELEDLPGVLEVTFDTMTGSFDIVFDAGIVSDDELEAALQLHGYDLVNWQEVRAMRAAQQKVWLLEQISSLASRAEHKLSDRGSYAAGVTKGSVDAYLRAARAFGLVTDAEIAELLPTHFLAGSD